MFRFRDLLHIISAPWQRDGWGQRWTTAVGIEADATAQAVRVALHAPWLAHEDSPNDALASAGSERRMPRYSVETDDEYRARLLNAWLAYRYAGSEQSVIWQLEAFGFSGVTILDAIDMGPVTQENWWSEFWVVVPFGGHGYIGSIPVADQAAIIALIKKWKPAQWICGSVTFITGGYLWDYHAPLTDWDSFETAGVLWGDSTALTVTSGSGF